MNANLGAARKPKSLRKGSRFAIFAPASPADAGESAPGIAELQRLGFTVALQPATSPTAPSQGYFASSTENRVSEFLRAATAMQNDAMIALRGGYGSNYLLSADLQAQLPQHDSPKCLVGYSDLSSLQIYLWQTSRWVTFYGPMIASGFRQGAGAVKGYEPKSFLHAISNTAGGWELPLQSDCLFRGESQGVVLGGCLTLLQATMGTPWELDTRDSILVLEDTGMKPYQVDRALMHLLQARKFAEVRGIVLGEFPVAGPTIAGNPTISDVCRRILAPLNIPIVYGSPIGHTDRPMLTLPLGIRARLKASGEGTLEFLEAAVID